MTYAKYHNRKTEIDGIIFDSQAEARRYSELKLMEAAGEIVNLEIHPQWKLVVNGVKIATYIGDFFYQDRLGESHPEDVKSSVTRKLPVYQLKKKLMLACYGIEIQEVKA